MKRLYTAAIEEHFEENRQMLFLMGPRQVGKTTNCLLLKKRGTQFFYLTWDSPDERALILQGPKAVAQALSLDNLSQTPSAVIFDEIHKYAGWRDFLKGFYDLYSEKAHILVTGSGRLDVFNKGGDSLTGRYFLYRYHPLSVAEIVSPTLASREIREPVKISEKKFAALWEFGGYPDPFLKANRRFFNKWSQLRFPLHFQEEIRDLTRIQEVKQLEVLAELLKHQVGHSTSYDSLSKKIRVSAHSIKKWLETLSALYYCFEIRPWSENISRSLLKEPRYFLWDWAQVPDLGARAENFVASHLLKAVHFWTDSGLGIYDLHYVRDKEKREVDFLVTRDGEPWFLVEVKLSENKGVSRNLHYFQQALQAPHAFQVVIDMPWVSKNCFKEKRAVVVPARTFLSQLV